LAAVSVTNDHEGLTLLGTFDKQHFRFTPFSYCIAWPHNHWRRNPPLKEEEERLLTWRPVYPALIVGKVDCLLHEGTRVSSTLQGHLLQHTTPTLMTQLGLLRGQT
jgi:hypothetical protein